MEIPNLRLDFARHGILSIRTGRTKMPDEPPFASLDRELTTNIVAAYVRRNQIGPDQLGTLISTVHRALSGLGKPAAEIETVRTPAVPIRRSVARDFVVCLRMRLARPDAQTASRYGPWLFTGETVLPRPPGERQDRVAACEIFFAVWGREGRNDANAQLRRLHAHNARS